MMGLEAIMQSIVRWTEFPTALGEFKGRSKSMSARFEQLISKNILIVDDSVSVRKLLRSFVESRTSFEVCGEAVNGLDAIEKARTLHPDLIVMDFSMPAMNGLEAGSVLKAMLPEVPVVMYTAHDSAAMKVQALAAGIRAVVQKHDIDGLVGHLIELLE
jgi:DNA-binding NarL/FixJ family response regulator